ncbi:MAG TPA: RIP metalloprotease RseP, partial [Candidatus Campbellbacteria bacterium]|nr:RIP metalloprotease RseP [Candidatus Campbellbacteria bacterium]
PSINPGEGKGSLGIAMDEIGTVNLPFYRAFWEGLKMTYNITIAVGVSIFYFISNAARGLAGFGQIMGPVGIVGVTGAAAKLGFGYLLGFIAMLSINLAIINILPFPALDGGRLLFLLAEKIKGSPVNYKFSNMVHTIGLIILIMLMLAITYKDIMRLV